MDIFIDNLENTSKKLGFPKTYQVKKDYLQELLLTQIYSGLDKPYIVLRGGMAISKFYNSKRFTEDLDFVVALEWFGESRQIEGIIEDGIRNTENYCNLTYSKRIDKGVIRYIIEIEETLFQHGDDQQSIQKIPIDFDPQHHTLLKPRLIRFIPSYKGLLSSSITVDSSLDIISDKVKSVIDRPNMRARDLYDLWIMVKKCNIEPDLSMVNKKFKLYGNSNPYGPKAYCFDSLRERIQDMEKVWYNELSDLMIFVPDYDIIASDIIQIFKNLSG
jgi:predicted nucleotidyltransferase component of viral defense system